MRFIQCARHVKEQNLYAFQYCGNIFYRAFKEVPPGTELLVWYDEKYPQFLGIPLGIQDYEFFRESGKAVLIFQFTLKKNVFDLQQRVERELVNVSVENDLQSLVF